MPNYSEAPEVEKIAQEIIQEHRNDLANANIYYMFRDKAAKSKGDIVQGRARKVSNIYKHVTGYDYIIEIAEDEWRTLTPKGKRAIVHHELNHCGRDENYNWTTFNHDFTGFLDVLELYGFYDRDLKSLRNKMQQMKLPIDERFEEKDSKGLRLVSNK